MDTMKITVLPDGSLKVETDKVSAANHMSAEGFLREAGKLMGGKQERKRKIGSTHSHSHEHGGHVHSHG